MSDFWGMCQEFSVGNDERRRNEIEADERLALFEEIIEVLRGVDGDAPVR